MNPYEKLEQAGRAWTVDETAAFLGYSSKHIYRLIRQGKIEGWMKMPNGRIMFCPCKLKAWMERSFNHRNGNGAGGDGDPSPDARKKNDNEAA